MFQYSAAPDPPPLRCENNRAATPGTAMAYRHYADRIKQHHQSTTTSGHHSGPCLVGPIWVCQNLHSEVFFTVVFRLYL
jgi:hypothetical protein